MKINQLNHYIGMKRIEPDAIPELRIMPWIVGALALSGLGVAAAGRRRLLVTWLAAFMVCAAVGLADFWRWEYDYGHNIDFEHAIIKVPGMTYQPPLIGTKQLLNFTAASWPALGTLCLGVAFALGIAALFVARRRGADVKRASVAMAVAVAACAPPGRQAIADKDRSCDYCRMTISDDRFGGQLITRKGKVYAFDAIECLTSYYLQNGAAGDGSSIWVADFANPGHWVEAKNALFVRNDAHQSPMGLNLVALRADADKAVAGQGQGMNLGWQEVLALVQSEHGTSWDHAEAVSVAR